MSSRVHLDEFGCLAVILPVVIAVSAFGALIILLSFRTENLASLGAILLALAPTAWLAHALASSRHRLRAGWFVGIWGTLTATAFVLAACLLLAMGDWPIG